MKVKEIMTRQVISIRPDTTVEEIARLLVTHRINALPVVEPDGKVIGIVSESDLFLKEKGLPFSAVKLPILFRQWVDPEKLIEIYEAARSHTARDIMNRNIPIVEAEDEIGHVAVRMASQNLRRVLVLQDGRLVGILSRADLIRLMARLERIEPPESDHSLFAPHLQDPRSLQR